MATTSTIPWPATHQGRHPLLHSICVIIAAAALLVSLLTLGQPAYWQDEVISILCLQDPFGEMIRDRIESGHQPLYFTLAWLWYRVVGAGEWLMRLPSWVCITAAVVLIARFTSRFATPTAGAVAAAIAALSPHLFYFAHLVRPYALVALLLALMIDAAIRRDQRPTRGNATWLGALTLALLLTHYSAAIPVATLAVWAAARRRPDWHLLGAMALATVCCSSWILWCLSRLDVAERFDHLAAPSAWDALLAPTQLLIGGWLVRRLRKFPLLSIAVAASAIPMAVATWALARSAAQPGRLVAGLWAAPLFIASVAVVFSGRNLFSTERYFIATILTAPIIVATALLYPAHNRWLTTALRAGAFLLLTGLSLLLAREVVDPKHNMPWPAVAARLNEHEPTQPVVAVRRGVATPLAFYLGRRVDTLVTPWARHEPVPRRGAGSTTPADLATSPSSTIWLVVRTTEWAGMQRGWPKEVAAVVDDLRQTFPHIKTTLLDDLTIIQMSRSSE